MNTCSPSNCWNMVSILGKTGKLDLYSHSMSRKWHSVYKKNPGVFNTVRTLNCSLQNKGISFTHAHVEGALYSIGHWLTEICVVEYSCIRPPNRHNATCMRTLIPVTVTYSVTSSWYLEVDKPGPFFVRRVELSQSEFNIWFNVQLIGLNLL